jgi:hypothetical protein
LGLVCLAIFSPMEGILSPGCASEPKKGPERERIRILLDRQLIQLSGPAIW